MKSFKNLFEIKADPGIMYHGSFSGDLRGGTSGLHLGTKEAATQALTVRIGYPVTGEWDGTREYGKTLLAGQNTMKKRGIFPTGRNCAAPENDYYPHQHSEGQLKYSDNSPADHSHKPSIKAFKIKGEMTNSIYNPHSDWKANGYMKASIKRGNARRGFYYKNEGEDSGSISAVVPHGGHVEIAESSYKSFKTFISEEFDARTFGKKLRKATDRDNESYEILDTHQPTKGCTWGQGGCLPLAHAVHKLLGPESKLVDVRRKDIDSTEHVAVQYGKHIFDHRGATLASKYADTYKKRESLKHDLEIVPHNPRKLGELAPTYNGNLVNRIHQHLQRKIT